MKKIFIYFFYGVYVFLFLGFIFHTSSNSVIFGKYSFQYTIFLLIFVVSFLAYRKAVLFIFRESAITLKDGKEFRISPALKIMAYSIIFIFCLVPVELYLEYKEQKYTDYLHYKFIHSYHPFLQNKLNVHDKDLHINSDGFRGEEISRTKPQDVFRIFVLGGSTVFSSRVTYEKSHVRILEKHLKQNYPEKNIEVLNAGNHWHTTEHSLVKYLFKIKDFNPDLIILWHGINDLYRSFTPSRFTFGTFQADYSHFFGSTSEMVFDHLKIRPVIQLKIFDSLLRLVSQYLFSDFQLIDKTPELKSIDIHDFPSIESFNRNMISLIRIIGNDGVKLVLATQPFLYREGLDNDELNSIWFSKMVCINRDYEYANLNSMIYGMNLFNGETKELAEDYNIPLIDLESRIPKNKEYFFDDFHYTEKGNALMAKEIFEHLIANKIIE